MSIRHRCSDQTSGWLSSAAAREIQTPFVANGSTKEPCAALRKTKPKKESTALWAHHRSSVYGALCNDIIALINFYFVNLISPHRNVVSVARAVNANESRLRKDFNRLIVLIIAESS